jgi:hypothetical protein
MGRRALAVVAVTLALVAGVACSGGKGGDDAGSAGGSADATAAADDAGGAGGGDATETGGEAVAEEAAAGPEDLGAQAPPEEAPERIVYTADVRVRVEEPTEAAAAAIALVEEAGGSLATQSEREGEDVVTVTVRVPVEGFRPALDAVGGLGEVLDRHVEAEDVTDRVVDLEARLENARASADRLRELYATATDVAQVVAVEQALTEREAEVESLAGQLQQLEDRADRSTITATFVAEGEPVVSAADEEERTGFAGGLRTGWDAVVAGAGALATVAGFLVPFLPFLLGAGLVLLLVRRRARRPEVVPSTE